MSASGAGDPMDPFEREIAESLRRRAAEVPATPLGYTDVQRRIVQRRRRSATMATAAVTLPAVVGLGYLAGRRGAEGERLAGSDPVFAATTVPFTTPLPVTTLPIVTTTGLPADVLPFGASYRCQGALGGVDGWQYFEWCEYVEGAGVPTTTIDDSLDPGGEPVITPQPTTTQMTPMSPLPPTTTSTAPLVDPTVLAEQVFVIDASGGDASMTEVVSLLGVTPRRAAVATRAVDETMVMPIGGDATAAFVLLERFGVAGFDTWTPDLVGMPVPEGVTVVLVIGRFGPQGWTP